MKVLINLGIILLLITTSMAVTKFVVEAAWMPLWMKIWLGLLVVTESIKGSKK